VLEVDPEKVRVFRPDSIASLPSNTPVGSRMAIMLGGAAFHAAEKLKSRLVAIAAHDLGIPAERAGLSRRRRVRSDGAFEAGAAGPSWWRSRTGISTGCRPDSSRGCRCRTSCRVPTGGALPTADGRVQMYPCYAFEFHLLLLAIDPDLGKPEIRRYVVGHDCGTVINPKIVRGMTLGGIAHGIGAALYEEFAYGRAGPDGGAEPDGLPAAVGARGAGDRRRRARDAVAAHRVRPEGVPASRAISARRPRSRAG